MSATPTKQNSPSEETPITPPRPRILCPGCHEELSIYETLGTGAALMYANAVDMAKLGLQCRTETCDLYIKGLPKTNPKAVLNPNIAKYVQMAKKEHDDIEATKKRAQEEEQKRKDELEAAEYAKYNPFSGAAAEKATDAAREQEAARIQQRLAEDQRIVASQWERLMEGVQAGLKRQNEEEARRSRKE